MSPGPPGTLRVTKLLAGLAIRRWRNRFAALRAKVKPGQRGATATKSARSNWVFFLLGPLLIFQAIMMSGLVVDRLDELGETRALAGVAWILTLLAASSFFNSLGGTSSEFANKSWTMEWLFGFPVKTRSLLFAKVGEYALTDTLLWLTSAPLLLMTYWHRGHGALSIPMALCAALLLTSIVGGLRIVAETAMRKRLNTSRLKNAAALCTLVSMGFLFFVLWFALTPSTPALLRTMTRATPILLSPFGLPANAAAVPMAWAGLLVVTALFVFGCVSAASRMVRTGLVTGGGANQGVRGVTRASAKPPRFKGALGKEILLLLRDRQFVVQTLVMPLFMIGFQLILNPDLFRSEEGGHASAIAAFSVACYVLMFGGFSVLAHERKSLWLLFTIPRSIAGVMREKTRIWAGVAMVYGIGVLAYAWRPGTGPSIATLTAPLFALIGIYVYAFIAAGFGCLGTDPFAQIEQRRLKPAWAYLFMMVVAMYGYGLSSDSIWSRVVSLVLAVLMAYAIWQKVAERLPLVLDPTARPVPRVSLADGLIAVAAFFHLSVAFSVGMAATDAAFATQVLVAYGLAGLLTTLVTLIVLGRLKIPYLWKTLGFVPTTGRNLLAWCLAGAGCAVFAAAYLSVGSRIYAPMREHLDHDAGIGFTLGVLVVVLAPLVEEFIFRGLVFRGMQRTLNTKHAVLASALLFAIVHPLLSFVPVFVTGVTAAVALHRTGTLWASVGVHATYNLLVVAVMPRIL